MQQGLKTEGRACEVSRQGCQKAAQPARGNIAWRYAATVHVVRMMMQQSWYGLASNRRNGKNLPDAVLRVQGRSAHLTTITPPYSSNNLAQRQCLWCLAGLPGPFHEF